MSRLNAWLAALGRSPVAAGIGILVGFGVIAISAVAGSVVWLAAWLGAPSWVAFVAGVPTLFMLFGLLILILILRETRRPYRDALKKVTRDYYADKSSLEHQLDPEHFALPSARQGSGYADPTWAGQVYDRYQLPHEADYGDR
jgi:predicted histidine transporter YuiF (NhaC family)